MNRKNQGVEEGNIIAISRLGFSAEHWCLFFGQEPKFHQGHIELPTSHRFQYMHLQPEILYFDGNRWIPSQAYFEYNFSDIVSKDKKVYIFQSSVDALAYFQIKSMDGTNATFFALGKNPDKALIRYLKELFHYAKFILCFPRGLMSTVSEIITVGFLANEQLTLEINADVLLCSYRGKKEQIPIDILSWSNVSKQIGFYPKNVKTLKPPKGHKSFYDLIRSLR